MPGLTIQEDGTIGAALASAFANANEGPKTAATLMTARAEVALKEAQRRQLEQQMGSSDQAMAANRAYWMAQQSPDTGSPNQAAWATGGGPVGTENVPPAGPAPLRAYTPDIAAKDTAIQDATTGNFNRMRDLKLAEYNMGATRAKDFSDVAQRAPLTFAQTQLALGGVPQTQAGLVTMQAQMKNELPMFAEHAQPANYAVVEKGTNNVVGRYASKDGVTDLATGRPIPVPPGHELQKSQEMPFENSAYKDPLNSLEGLNKKVAIDGLQLSPTEAARAAILINKEYPLAQKIEKDDAGNITRITYNEKAVPPVFAALVNHLNTGQLGALQPPPVPGATTTAPPPAPVPTLGGGPGQRATVPDILAAQTPPPAAAAAATRPPGPIIEPPTGPGTQKLVGGSGDTQLKEVLNNPLYQKAASASVSYNAMQDAFKTNSPGADLHGVYMLAKIFDPQSAVREGEVATAANTTSGFEKFWGMYNKFVNGEGQLSPAQRADFMEQAYVAATAHYNKAKGLTDYAQERAKILGLDPRLVAPPLEKPAPPDLSQINTRTRTGVPGAPPPRTSRYGDTDAIVGGGR